SGSAVSELLHMPRSSVMGEDPEPVAEVVRVAMGFRATFKPDVVIDMLGYRRRGHNESDEPTCTQPVLYREIEKRTSVRDGYLEHLLSLGEVTAEDAEAIAEERRGQLEPQRTEDPRRAPRAPPD